jgi:hypothetical protein
LPLIGTAETNELEKFGTNEFEKNFGTGGGFEKRFDEYGTLP